MNDDPCFPDRVRLPPRGSGCTANCKSTGNAYPCDRCCYMLRMVTVSDDVSNAEHRILTVYRNQVSPTLKDRTLTLFKERVMEAHLRLDLLSSQCRSNSNCDYVVCLIHVNTAKSNLIDSKLPDLAWGTLGSLLNLADTATSTISQAAVMWNILRTQDAGLLFIAVCLAKPVYNTFMQNSLWQKGRTPNTRRDNVLVSFKKLAASFTSSSKLGIEIQGRS